MTPKNTIPRPEGIGVPIRLTAPAGAAARRSPARLSPGSARKAFVTTALVAVLVAGWALLLPHNGTKAAPAAAPAQVVALVALSPTVTNTPAVAPTQPAATATPTQVPATATPTEAPAPAAPTQVPVAPAAVPPAAGAAAAGALPAGIAQPPASQTVKPAATPTLTPSPTATAATAPAPSPVAAVPAQARIAGFPSVAQWLNLDCEYAAAAAVTLYWGHLVSQSTFVNTVPSNPNPHLGFRGAINAPFGGLMDYGVYAEPLVPVLEQRGYNAVAFYGGAARLQAEVAAGHPVVVWITAGKYIPRTPVTANANGATFTLVPGEHAVVIYGYDSGGVYIMDVSHGQFDYATWGSFLTRWSYFDQMALVITPQ